MLTLLTYKLFKFNLHNMWFFPYTVFNFLAAIKKLSEMLDSNPELLWYSHAVYIYILYSVHSRVECGHFFLIGQNRSSNQRSGTILEVRFQNFGARASAHASKFPFSNKSRGSKY